MYRYDGMTARAERQRQNNFASHAVKVTQVQHLSHLSHGPRIRTFRKTCYELWCQK